MYYFHMFFTFFIFSQSLDRFNLNPPFEMTDVNEIGNWSLVGSTVNRKFALQLTTGVESEYGALCYRSPFVYSNFTWVLDVSFSDLPGNDFYLYFTNEVCYIKLILLQALLILLIPQISHQILHVQFISLIIQMEQLN